MSQEHFPPQPPKELGQPLNYQPPPPVTHPLDKVGVGVAAGFAMAVVGYPLAWSVAYGGTGGLGLLCAPLLAKIVLGVFCISTDRFRRFGKGMLLSIVMVVALIGLLMGVCFIVVAASSRR